VGAFVAGAPPAAEPDVPPGTVPAGLAEFGVMTGRTDPHVMGPVAVDLPPGPEQGSKHADGDDAGYAA
jgi:hypothetical protein